MRVVIVVPSLDVGGAERVMVLLARGLPRTGIDVTVVAIDGTGVLRTELEAAWPDGTAAGVRVIDLGRTRARTALPDLVRAIRAARPDVVISSQTHVNALLALLRPLLGDVRLVAREPMLWVDGPNERPAGRALRRSAVRRADVVLASSPTMRAELAALLGRAVEVLPNPVDVDGLRRRGRAAVRPEGPGRRLLCVSRLADGKGLEDLLRAFGQHAVPDDLLTIVGDGPLRRTVESDVERLGVDGRVRLTGTLVDPAPLLAGADALVLPSRSEGMPNVALEALAVGTPVVATTDLVTLGDLARDAPAGAIRTVPRGELGRALAEVRVLDARPRPSLLPPGHRTEVVAEQLRHLLGLDRPLRILLPTLAPYPSALAPSVQSANMAQALAELGHDVTLIAANEDPALRHVAGAPDPATLYGFDPAYRAEVHAPRERRGQSYVNAIRLARRTRRSRPDLMLSRDLRGSLLVARRGVTTVFEAHSLTALTGAQERIVLHMLLRTPAFRGFVVISQALADDLIATFDVPSERVLVAHDAVRPTLTTPPSPRPDDGVLRVGYTGSLFAGRGVERLVEVAQRAPWIELHLVGGPAEAAESWRRQLEAGPEANVVLHGMVSPARARELQTGMDVLVAPFERRVGTDSGVDTSRWMSPMKVFEYMAAGRPIVISDLPVLREILRPDEDALMVPPEDTGALLDAFLRLRDDRELGRRLAASALSRVHERFTWEQRAQRIVDWALRS